MSSFDSVMKTEKLAVIALVIIIAVALSAYLIVTYGDEIFDNLTGSTETIEIGDCADVHYTGSFENGTVFDTSYEDVANQSGIYDSTRPYAPLKTFISFNLSELPPEGYDTYYQGIEGFMEGLIGLKEGETKTLGPIPPEKAYGVYPKIGDEIVIVDPTTGDELTTIVFTDIQENASMPIQYIGEYGNVNTTLFHLRYDTYSLGEEITLYPSWENSTVVTRINETMMWLYTTPPEDKRENFTWVENTGYGLMPYWENASSVTTMNITTIIITHTPEIDSTLSFYETICTVVSLNDTEINVSYEDATGELSYDAFDRTVTIERNGSQVIAETYPTEEMDQLLQVIKFYYDPDLTLSVHELADETLYFEVEIVNIYKTSQ